MQMEEGLDTGPMLLERMLDIAGKMLGKSRTSWRNLGAGALSLAGEPRTAPSAAGDGVTYASKVDKAGDADRLGSADPSRSQRQVLAFAPMPGAWFECVASGSDYWTLKSGRGHGAPGEVLDDSITIACRQGSMRPLTVQRAGRSAMTAGDLLRGFAIPKNTILE